MVTQVQDAADQLVALEIGETKKALMHNKEKDDKAELQDVMKSFYEAESLELREKAEEDAKAAAAALSAQSSTDTTSAETTSTTKESITSTTNSSSSTTASEPSSKQEPLDLSSLSPPLTDGATEASTTSTAATEATAPVASVAAVAPINPKARYVTPKDFELLKVIGMGAFGKVLQVRNKRSKKILAMKVISKRLLRRKAGYIENVQAERNILTKVRHPFVVSMHCSFQTKEKLFIIMDFLAGGELFLRLGREGIFMEKTAAFYLAEIILALDHLHHHGVLHRDLKPENILLGSDGHVCVTDFGLAKDFSGEGGFQTESDDSRALTVCGTLEYMAPEMIARQGYGRAADYWSLGCIAFEMLSGQPPFRSKNGAKDLYSKIMSEKVKMPDGSTPAACKLLKGLLNRNVQVRLGAARSKMFEVGGVTGLKGAAFFADIDWDKLGKKEMEPPDKFPVENDQDLRHFHDEFTGMPLPRSVVDMSGDRFNAKRIESDAFRGFSFIQEDFVLPDRQDGDIQSYWDSVEGDGESLSDGASSKCDGEFGDALEETANQRKKRPPRKKKKKKPEDESAVGIPAKAVGVPPPPSFETSPSPSASTAYYTPSDNDVVKVPVKPVEVIAIVAPVPPSPARAVPVTPPPPPARKAVQQSWQSVSVNASKKATGRSTTKAPVSQLNPRASPHTIQNQSQRNTVTPARQANSQPHHYPGSNNLQPPSPSTDWRQHTRTPETSGKVIRQPPVPMPGATISWPSLGPDPPLSSNSNATTRANPTTSPHPNLTAKLQGAWVTQTKR
jgi:p70 ribosomal S6 kinase